MDSDEGNSILCVSTVFLKCKSSTAPMGIGQISDMQYSGSRTTGLSPYVECVLLYMHRTR